MEIIHVLLAFNIVHKFLYRMTIFSMFCMVLCRLYNLVWDKRMQSQQDLVERIIVQETSLIPKTG